MLLNLGDGSCLQAKKVQTLKSHLHDFVLGQQLLHDYNAVVDYGLSTLTFTMGDGRYLRVVLHE